LAGNGTDKYAVRENGMRLVQPPPLATPHTETSSAPKGQQVGAVFARPWSDWFSKVVTPGLQASFRFQSGTHSDRASSNASILPQGSLFKETDRGVFYMASGSPTVWQYAFGTMIGLAANRPSDLGESDAGFQFLATDTPQFSIWTGSAWVNA